MEHGISTPSMFIGSLCTGVLILFSEMLRNYENIHLPPIIVETMQVLSYTGAVIVSCFTVYNFMSKKRKK